MKKVLTIILILIIKTGFSQVYNRDSVYFLNIERVYKIKVIKQKAPYVSIPQLNISFPYSSFDSINKVIGIIDIYPIPFITDDTTNALIRISRVIDKSYGSGSTDDLLQYATSLVELDSLVKLERVSPDGTFYLNIGNKKHPLGINQTCSLIVKNTVDNKIYKIDYIVEYFIKNYGYFRRKVECETN
jgi:hypothetical protein